MVLGTPGTRSRKLATFAPGMTFIKSHLELRQRVGGTRGGSQAGAKFRDVYFDRARAAEVSSQIDRTWRDEPVVPEVAFENDVSGRASCETVIELDAETGSQIVAEAQRAPSSEIVILFREQNS
jgi:hypothetical protein